MFKTKASFHQVPTFLKGQFFWKSLFLVFGLFGLLYFHYSHYENKVLAVLTDFNQEHVKFEQDFEAHYYFSYEDLFLKKLNERIKKFHDLKKVKFFSIDGELLFDSEYPTSPDQSIKEEKLKEIPSNRKITQGFFSLDSIFRSKKILSRYEFSFHKEKKDFFIHLVFFTLFFIVLFYFFPFFFKFLERKYDFSLRNRIGGLRFQFVFTVLIINLVTGGSLYFTISNLQIRQYTDAIYKESVLFSKYTTSSLMREFNQTFYFQYNEKFIPFLNRILSSYENLVSIKVISLRTETVLFDSEKVSSFENDKNSEFKSIQLNEKVKKSLSEKMFFSERPNEQDSRFRIIDVFRDKNVGDPLFAVEYHFNLRSLDRLVSEVKTEMTRSLFFPLLIGFLISIFFAQLVISPLRKLVVAFQRLARGEFDFKINLSRSDEVGQLVTAFNVMVQELRKKKELRKYLSDSTYRQIMETVHGDVEVKVSGRRQTATILFSDIRNFVSHCENLSAEEITEMLNDYFSEMVEIVYRHQGEVDKFIGDALLAVFYEESEKKQSSLSAIYCALEMREKLVQFNQKRKSLGKAEIEIGVGITYGTVISGPIGSSDRRDFTVIGDVVNLANRIEKISKKGRNTRIVFDHEVKNKLEGLLDYEFLTQEQVKGKEDKVDVYELVQIKDVDTLVSHLKSKDVSLRMNSVELLGYSRNEDTSSVLYPLIENSKEIEGVRLNALQSLYRLSRDDHSKTISFLFDVLKKEKNEKVISSIIMILGKLVKGSQILSLEKFLKSKNSRIVANVIEAFGSSGDQRSLDLILPFLSSRHNRIKANAAMALFAAGHYEVIETLKPMLMHSDVLMRASAAFALGELTKISSFDRLEADFVRSPEKMKVFLAEIQESVPMLVTLLQDSEPMVRRQAILALGKIKDKSTILPLVNSIRLDQESKEMIQDLAFALREIGSHQLVRDLLYRIS